MRLFAFLCLGILACAKPPASGGDGGDMGDAGDAGDPGDGGELADDGGESFDGGYIIPSDDGGEPPVLLDGGTEPPLCPTDCDDGNVCTQDVCDNGTCTNPSSADGLACGTSKECKAGACVAVTPTCPASCADTNPCTQDACQNGVCVHPNAANGLACGLNSTCKAGVCTETPATMADYWAGRANFERINMFNHPSLGGGWLFFNVSQDVEVVGTTWYIYIREIVVNPALCGGKTSIRTSVCTSTDKGKTLTNCAAIVNPTAGETECGVTDGDVFKDPASSTWHFLAQCIGNSGGWKLCHWTAPSPTGPFTPDGQGSGPVSARGGDIWKKILGGSTTMHDEGTPEFIQKVGSEYYISFHGIDSTNRLVRGIAKTTDFVNWTAINNGPIFSKQDCDGWAVPWIDGNKCWGGGAASVIKEGNLWYMVEEASDLFGPCAAGQHWFWGLMRTTDITQAHPFTQWSANPMAFSSKEPDNKAPNKSGACALAYPKIFRDTDGFIYLFASRGHAHSDPSPDVDKTLGHYVYKLRKNAPRATYEFREGPGYLFTLSDIIGYGDSQAVVFNTGWTAASPGYALDFNGSNSIFVAPNNGALNITGDVTLSVRLTLNKAPAGKSAFLAGRFRGYWLELYKDGSLCAWINEASTMTLKNTCKHIEADYLATTPVPHTYQLKVSGKNTLSLWRDGVQLSSAAVVGGVSSNGASQLTAGAASTSATAYLGSFTGHLGSLTVSSP